MLARCALHEDPGSICPGMHGTELLEPASPCFIKDECRQRAGGTDRPPRATRPPGRTGTVSSRSFNTVGDRSVAPRRSCTLADRSFYLVPSVWPRKSTRCSRVSLLCRLLIEDLHIIIEFDGVTKLAGARAMN